MNFTTPAASKRLHQRRFLAAYSRSGSLTVAARWGKITRNAHYDWMATDPAYPAQFAEAHRKAIQTLEDEMIRRGHEGLRKAIRYKGKIVGYETEYSDRMLELALRGNAPEKYREKPPEVAPAQSLTLNVFIQTVLSALADAPESVRISVAQKLIALETQANAERTA